MRHHNVAASILLVASALLAAACGDSTGPRKKTLDVSALLQEATLSGAATAVAAMGGPVVLGVGLPRPVNCSYSATLVSYTCHPQSAGGMQVTLQYTLLDAAGRPVQEADADVVDAIHTVLDMTGAFAVSTTQGADSMRLERHDDKTLSGLTSGHHELNGSATSKTRISMPAGPLTMTTSETTTNVLFGPVGQYRSVPIGGSAMIESIISSTSDLSFTSHMTMTFSPSGIMTLVLNTGSTTRTCQINLAQPVTQFGTACL